MTLGLPMSSCHPFILSSFHLVILSSCHPFILSSFHLVILSSLRRHNVEPELGRARPRQIDMNMFDLGIGM